MIKAFGHTAKRAGIEILVRPNATGMAAYHGRLQSGVSDQTVKCHGIHGEARRQSKTICFHTLKTDVSANPCVRRSRNHREIRELKGAHAFRSIFIWFNLH
jgi:hypothetical protein